jgi:hypothetical protein
MVQIGKVGPGRTDPLIALVVKTLKLTIYLFLEFWPQIWFQKYYVSPMPLKL